MTTITLRKNLNGMNTVGMEEYVDDTEIASMVAWIDHIPLTRPKTNMSKDFEDGVLMAEIVKHYFPKLVELHNYNPASSTKQKLENWYLLNRRVLKRLGMDLSDDVIRALANGKRQVIDRILILLRMQIDNLLTRQEALVPVVPTKSTGRSSPSKSPRKTHKGENPQTNPDRSALEPLALPSERSSQVKSPRRIYTKGEIPHNHPDRSTYFSDKRMLPDNLPIYSYMYNHTHVPRLIMEEKELEIMQKDETIQMLNAKIQSMERLLNLKQVRIEDLHAKLVASRGVYYVTEGGTRKIIR